MTLTQRQDQNISSIGQHLEKIVVDVGVGRLSQQPNFEEKILPQIQRDVALLAGQQPQVRRARKSISGFKIRQGQIVGLRTTLRGRKMVDFFQRFIKIVLPRVRDFRGIDQKSIDTHGILNLGLKEQLVFPEIRPEESSLIFPLGINVVPRLKDREAALHLYRELGLPLRRGKT